VNNTVVLCGLGNPGKSYTQTRHNLGFLLIDYLRICFHSASFVEKFSGEISKCFIDDINIIFFKPMTFMNNSGKALFQLINFYHIQKSSVIVIHDDVDLNFADLRIKKGGGNGGHNGLKSIDQFIGNDYWRIRFGIGKDQVMDLSNYVLSAFFKLEIELLNIIFEFFKNNIYLLIKDIENNKSKFIENYCCFKKLKNDCRTV
jgi:PTH1 family peptidyl-tRNA hydrolase